MRLKPMGRGAEKENRRRFKEASAKYRNGSASDVFSIQKVIVIA